MRTVYRDIIFSTIHGSRLYGLDRPGSDIDTFTVLDNESKLDHNLESPFDCTAVGIKRFLELCQSGSHQSLEALFSPVKIWHPQEWRKWKPYLDSLHIGGSEVFEKYERTIKKFCYGDLKQRRHAVRLAFNLKEMRETGRFNPRLSESQVFEIKYLSFVAKDEELLYILFNNL